jgi:ferritin
MAIPLGKRVHELLNKQVTEEFAASYLCFAMSGVFADMELFGCSKWMLNRSKEKLVRGEKLYNYITKRGVKVKLLQLPAPKQDWRAPLHIFEEFLRFEQKVANVYVAGYECAVADKDYPSQSFLMQFIEMQIEAEAAVVALLDRLRKMQTSDMGVLLFDAEVAKMNGN